MAIRGPAASVQIVEPQFILNAAVIANENWNLYNLHFDGELAILEWLAKRRLIRNSSLCPTCQIQMSFIKRNDIIDKWRWQCRLCKASASVRKNSFFSHSHLSLRQIIIITYCWAMDFPQNIIAHEAEIGQGSTHTMVDWASFCREICEQHLMDHPMEIGGLDQNGMSLTVEIDESKFFHRKYNRGQWREGHWVFGGIERNSGKCFLVEVPDRTEATLLGIIERYSDVLRDTVLLIMYIII
jgi:transposase-like protein